MMPQAVFAQAARQSRRLWLCLLLCCAGIAGANEVAVERDPIALIAQSLRPADPAAHWDFADTLLQVTVEAYDAELALARRESPHNDAKRHKLRRWLAGTRQVRDGLVDARLRLSEGASLEIHVDPLGQVFLFVDGQPYACSAPRPVAERALRRAFVERYCAVGDCSALESGARPAATTPHRTGTWTIAQDAPPEYRVDGVLNCQFADLAQRAAKARHCDALAADLYALRAALLRADALGYGLDWGVLREPPRSTGGMVRVAINRNGDFVRLALPVLGRLPRPRWSGLLDALRRSLADPLYTVRIDWADGAPTGLGAKTQRAGKSK